MAGKVSKTATAATKQKASNVAGYCACGGEQQWSLEPESPWAAGAYRLRIETRIEDLAGNNIGKAFEVELNAPTPRRTEPGVVKLPFELPEPRALRRE